MTWEYISVGFIPEACSNYAQLHTFFEKNNVLLI